MLVLLKLGSFMVVSLSEIVPRKQIAGQLSDSACGTLKRCIKNDLKSGKGKKNIWC